MRIGTSLLNPAGVLVDLMGRRGGGPEGVDVRIVPFGEYAVCFAVPSGHRLAGAKSLKPEDLRGERLMMCRRGDAEALDGLRDMLEEKYPEIEIVDAPYFYDAGVFNKSERSGCILLTLDAWAGVHPSLVTIPAEWDYRVPYGLLYSKTPSRCVTAFLESLGL